MSRFGKFVAGIAVIGAAAAGVYYYLDQKSRKTQTAGNGDDENETADSIKNAADRAYTTIKHGTDETVNKVREAFAEGGKGREVLDEAKTAAGKIKDDVVDSASKVINIMGRKDSEDDVDDDEEFDDDSEDLFDDDKDSEDVQDSASEQKTEEAQDTASEQETAEAAQNTVSEEEPADPQEAFVDGTASDYTKDNAAPDTMTSKDDTFSKEEPDHSDPQQSFVDGTTSDFTKDNSAPDTSSSEELFNA